MAMARNGEPFYHCKGCYVAPLSGLVLSTCIVLLQEPLLSFSLNDSGEISSFFPVYDYYFLLNPLTFHLNMLWFILHVTRHGSALATPFPDFLTNHLPGAAQIFSFFTLVFGLPLWIHAAVSEGSVGLAIGAVIICTALVLVLASVFQKLLIASCRAGRAFVPAVFTLCISIGFLNLFDPLLYFSNTNQNNTLIQATLHYLLLIVIFFIFMLGVTLLILCFGALAVGNQAATQAKYLVITVLSLAFSALLVGVYVEVFLADIDMHGRQ